MSETDNDHFPVYQVRPRFRIETPLSVEDLTKKIKTGLGKEDAPCKGRFAYNQVTLYLPVEERHYWSPQLNLTLEESGKGTLLRGLYGPRPTVWTMFVFFYTAIGFAILVVGTMGISYLSLGKPAAILWWVPLLALVFLSLYLVAYFGKRMGKDQMVTLHRFMTESTGLDI